MLPSNTYLQFTDSQETDSRTILADVRYENGMSKLQHNLMLNGIRHPFCRKKNSSGAYMELKKVSPLLINNPALKNTIPFVGVSKKSTDSNKRENVRFSSKTAIIWENSLTTVSKCAKSNKTVLTDTHHFKIMVGILKWLLNTITTYIANELLSQLAPLVFRKLIDFLRKC